MIPAALSRVARVTHPILTSPTLLACLSLTPCALLTSKIVDFLTKISDLPGAVAPFGWQCKPSFVLFAQAKQKSSRGQQTGNSRVRPLITPSNPSPRRDKPRRARGAERRRVRQSRRRLMHPPHLGGTPLSSHVVAGGTLTVADVAARVESRVSLAVSRVSRGSPAWKVHVSQAPRTARKITYRFKTEFEGRCQARPGEPASYLSVDLKEVWPWPP